MSKKTTLTFPVELTVHDAMTILFALNAEARKYEEMAENYKKYHADEKDAAVWKTAANERIYLMATIRERIAGSA